MATTIVPFKKELWDQKVVRLSRTVSKTHTGTDWAMPVGTELFACEDGRITQVGKDAYGGYWLYLVGNSGRKYLYLHISRDIFGTVYSKINSVARVSHSVKQGQVICYSGNTGKSTGPHLHFELRIDGKSVIPFPYLEWKVDVTQIEIDPEKIRIAELEEALRNLEGKLKEDAARDKESLKNEYESILSNKANEIKDLQATQASLEMDIAMKLSEIETLRKEAQEKTDSEIKLGDLKLDTDHIAEDLAGANPFAFWRNLVTSKVKDQKIREFLSFDILIILGINILGITGELLKMYSFDPVVANVITGGAIVLKQTITKLYDSNKDGVLGYDDTHIIKDYLSSSDDGIK